MVTARMKRAAQALERELILEVVEEEHRPQSSRGRYAQDASVSALVQNDQGAHFLLPTPSKEGGIKNDGKSVLYQTAF